MIGFLIGYAMGIALVVYVFPRIMDWVDRR